MEVSPWSSSVAADFQKIVDKRNSVVRRINKAAYNEGDRINGVVTEWLGEVDELIQEMNDVKVRKTYEWSTKMANKIKSLDEKTELEFEPFYIPHDYEIQSQGVISPLASPRSLEEDFQEIVGKRNFVARTIDKADDQRAVMEWLDEVDELIKEMNDVRVVKTYEWHSKMTKKIKSLREKSEGRRGSGVLKAAEGPKIVKQNSNPTRSAESIESAFPSSVEPKPIKASTMPITRMVSPPSPHLLEEDFREIVEKRNFVARRIDKADDQRAVMEWLAQVDKLIDEMNDVRVAKTYEWHSKMTKKIKSLREKFDGEYDQETGRRGSGVFKEAEVSPPWLLWLEEYFEELNERWNLVARRIDQVDDQRAVMEWLDEVDELINEMNDVGVQKTYDWGSKMINKIKSLEEKYEFEPFYIPNQMNDYEELFKVAGAESNESFRTCPEGHTSTKAFAQRSKSAPTSGAMSTTLLAKLTPTQAPIVESPFQQPFNSIQTSGINSTLSHAESMPVMFTFSSGKSKKEAPYQDLEVQQIDACLTTISHSSANSPLEFIPASRVDSMSSASSASSNPIEEGKIDDIFQGSESSIGGFMYLGSTRQAQNDILNALKDDRYNSIGLFGEKGSGKTTLVKAKVHEYENIFSLVVFVSVSENIDIANIQKQIASQLNLKIHAIRSNHKRASTIESTLHSKDKVLVIFDDVSTNFGLQDIEEIGIPDPSKHCKILLITHDKKYCSMIRCHPWIPMRPLSNEDAWKLLQQRTWIDRDSPPDLFDVAREVSFQCKGLPRVIDDVVSSLHNKKTQHWAETLDCLRHSTACHQIFISFRGIDTRDDFTASLFDALIQGGFKVFKDDEQLRSGDQVSDALTTAIEQSRCSIVVLSKNYAESSWCLDELGKILKCREEKKQLVLPIFYKVDPSNVRHLKGSFGEAMEKKKERFNEDKIQEWTSLLYKVAGLSGKDYKNGSQINFIKEIVQYVRDNKHRLHIV